MSWLMGLFAGGRAYILILGSSLVCVAGGMLPVVHAKLQPSPSPSEGYAALSEPASQPPLGTASTVTILVGAIGTIGSIAGAMFDRWNKRAVAAKTYLLELERMKMSHEYRMIYMNLRHRELLEWVAIAVPWMTNAELPASKAGLPPPPLPAPPGAEPPGVDADGIAKPGQEPDGPDDPA